MGTTVLLGVPTITNSEVGKDVIVGVEVGEKRVEETTAAVTRAMTGIVG